MRKFIDDETMERALEKPLTKEKRIEILDNALRWVRDYVIDRINNADAKDLGPPMNEIIIGAMKLIEESQKEMAARYLRALKMKQGDVH